KVRDRSISQRKISAFSFVTRSDGFQFLSTSSAPPRQLRVTELFLRDELRATGL
ncbi:hypothetical protein HAX54_020891, partial [Datura stramonium]|nr:hypothetical protein [Datura stramonium]